MAISSLGGNVHSQIVGSPELQRDSGYFTRVAVISNDVVGGGGGASLYFPFSPFPAWPGSGVKAVLKSAKYASGPTASTDANLSSTLAIQRATAPAVAYKDMATLTVTAGTILEAGNAGYVPAAFTLVATTTDRKTLSNAESPRAGMTATEPDINVCASDVIVLKVTAGAGDTITAGGIVMAVFQMEDVG